MLDYNLVRPELSRSSKTIDVRSNSRAALFLEIARALKHWEFWLTLAWVDIRGRYRRTVLGPFWTTLNSLFFVSILATVYSLLWRIDLASFLPFVAAGYFVWTFISVTISESCQVLYSNGEALKTMPITPMALITRVVARNLIVFLHNLVVFIGLALLLGQSIAMLPLILPGLAVITVFCLGLGTCLAFLCCRFRDFEQVVQSLLLILFFVSPILWKPKFLPEHANYVMDFNVIYHLLRVVRDPMLDAFPSGTSFGLAIVAAGSSVALGAVVYVRCRGRLAYWL